jgi:hypothetical protein
MLISQRILGALSQTVQQMKAREQGFHLRSILRPNSSWLLSYRPFVAFFSKKKRGIAKMATFDTFSGRDNCTTEKLS